jgi:AraC family transcriptional regulator
VEAGLSEGSGGFQMFRNDFPELGFLRKMIADLESGRAPGGWPNVIINTKTKLSYRPDIKGTLSVFSNIKGDGYCSVEGRKLRVDEEVYFISNKGQEYTLQIENNEPAETFNIHFSTQLLDEYLFALNHKDEHLLQNISGRETTNFYNKLYRKDERFNQIINTIYRKGNTGELTDLMTEELLSSLLHHILDQQELIQRDIDSIDTIKAATREEIYSRLTAAVDYIYSFYNKDIKLDELATVACMSKFHFLRLFKEVYKATPHQYITGVRMKKAADLLRKTELSVTEISWLVGYDDAGSFGRAFHQYYGQRPQAYRGRTLQTV